MVVNFEAYQTLKRYLHRSETNDLALLQFTQGRPNLAKDILELKRKNIVEHTTSLVKQRRDKFLNQISIRSMEREVEKINDLIRKIEMTQHGVAT